MKITSLLWLATIALCCTPCVKGVSDSELSKIFEINTNSNEEITGGFSKVWGTIQFESNPWILSNIYGWFYIEPLSTSDGYWIWIENLGWIYSEAGTFPTLYHSKSQSWVLLDLSDPLGFKYFNLSTREWHRIDKVGFDSWLELAAVPIELQGLVFGSYAVGSYYFSYIDNNPNGTMRTLFYYNNLDGWFYPMEYQAWGRASISIPIMWNRYKVILDGEVIRLTIDDMIFGGEPIEITFRNEE